MFVQIFMRYPKLSLPQEQAVEEAEGEEVKEKTQEVTPEEKEAIEGNTKRFTAELEECMFELYAEPDKHGKPSAAGKYKLVVCHMLCARYLYWLLFTENVSGCFSLT